MGEKAQKTKWQQLMNAPKGGLEYNPDQSFALQVFWVLRSPRAALEMIEKGFKPCVAATRRDSPTTLCYFFRISRDQRLAIKLKNQVKTIGQHPHYQPAFKSIEMGISQVAVEAKLKNSGIDILPLLWGPEEPMSDHIKQLDFDPVVLECTEVYLDNRSFYEHAGSPDWMKASAEIWKPSRSLKPKTFCLGHPSDDIWERTLESSLKAIRFTQENQTKILQPGVFFCNKFPNDTQFDLLFFLEIDLFVQNQKLQDCRSHVSLVQQELEAPYMIIFPTNILFDTEEELNEQELWQLRLILAFPFTSSTQSSTLRLLADSCQRLEGQLIVFHGHVIDPEKAHPHTELGTETAKRFLDQSGLPNTANISVMNGDKTESNLAGYPLHPKFRDLIPNRNFNYKL